MLKLLNFDKKDYRTVAVILGGLLAFALFLTTLQMTINGSPHPYATDVGEIQNALPRWGTIHFPGYPLYSLTGSGFVTALRILGIAPAISASLLSAVWGAVAIALLVALELEYEVLPAAALATALLFALSTSFWVDASIAEVHTLTMVLMLASIMFAVRFSRSGRRSDLLWLSLFATQTILHQRAMVFMGPGLLLLALRQKPALWRGLPSAIAVAILGSLVYLYLPIRDWQGAEWTFNQPGSWRGFWGLVLDTKTERIVTLPETGSAWLERSKAIASLLAGDWPLVLLITGLLGNGIVALRGRRLEALALFLIWIPFLILSLIIWEGRVSDALLAVNLPVLVMSAFGLGVLTAWIAEWSRMLGFVIIAFWLALSVFLFVDGRPDVLALTRDPAAETIIKMAETVEPGNDDRPITLMSLWGNDYWALIYAQAYQNRLSTLNLVDHNADLAAIMDSNDRLLTPNRTFYLRPLSWWDDRYGQVYLSAHSADIVEVDTEPPLTDSNIMANQDIDLGNEIKVLRTELKSLSPETLQLVVYWEALSEPKRDYSVAVHIVSTVPPEGPDDILSQSDSQHPVGGWYPTSRWASGEVIRDEYIINVPAEPKFEAEALQLGMYYVAPDGSFVNTDWLTIPLGK